MVMLEMRSSGSDRPPAPRPTARDRAPLALGLALLILSGYAIFAHGAIQAPAEPRLQVAVALVCALVAAVWLWMRGLRLPEGRPAVAGALFLTAFAVWSAISLAWSVTPDLTWIEFNRDVTYALVLSSGLFLGASTGRALRLTAYGFLVLAAFVTLDALGQKLLPGIRIGGLIDLNQTGRIARLQEPLGYWNALALLLAMAAPVALVIAGRRASSRPARLTALILLALMFVTIGFTYSRGGLLALILGLVVCLALSGSPLRLLMWLALTGLATAPSIVLGLTSKALTMNGVPLPRRESAGLLLLVVLAACSVLLWLAGDRLLVAEQSVTVEPPVRRGVIRGLIAAGCACLLIGVAALVLSSRGFAGTFSHLWASFTATGGVSVSDPTRLVSADSANRWVWWKEAAGAISDRPLGGWGAGSFPVVHLLYRHDTLSVQHPHSMPLQWLAETGIIGLLLIMGSWLLLVVPVAGSVRRETSADRRILTSALLAGVVAYTVHALYDWDWDIPGLTVPLFVLMGVLAGSLRLPVPGDKDSRLAARPPLGPALRILALAFIAVALSAFAASVVLPTLAASKASSAMVAASGSSLSALQRAQRDASAAAGLNPVSDAGPRAEAIVALHRGDPELARAYLLQAVRRQPADYRPWSSLALLDLEMHHPVQAAIAARNLLQLDPLEPGLRNFAQAIAQQAMLDQAPPRSSATRITTP